MMRHSRSTPPSFVLLISGMLWLTIGLAASGPARSQDAGPPPLGREILAAVAPAPSDDAPAQTAGSWASDQQFDALLQALAGMERHGLDAARYRLDVLRELRHQPQRRGPLATAAWLQAATDLVHGLQPLQQGDSGAADRRQAIDLQQTLADALATGRVADSLDRLAPAHPEYRLLLQELARLYAAPAVEVAAIPRGALLGLGSSGARVLALRQRLDRLGYPTDTPDTSAFDAALHGIVQEFQADRGLEPDGKVGPATLSILNLSREDKIDRIRVNLERWRRLPADLGQRHVRVNIAGFEVSAYADGQPVQSHRAIVGRLERQTPSFSDTIQYIVFNPWWETPAKLAREDELPLFRRDPAAVERLGFQVLNRATGRPVDASTIDWQSVPAYPFPYRLRQAPGPLNALGQVKILFPNRHAIYLHDTPKRSLFDRITRTFSSGCIRVQGVFDLVAWLLDEPAAWSPERIQAMIDAGQEKWVTLRRPVPVHILYQTAIATGDGRIHYLPDIYDRDPDALRALDAATAVAQVRR